MPPWADSRRLFGASLWLESPGVVLDAALDPGRAVDELAQWRIRAQRITSALGWRSTCTLRRRGDRAALALTAPVDALMAATLANEWAWTGAATDGDARAAATMDPSEERLPADESAALARLRELVAAEANPALVALAGRASAEQVPLLIDEEVITLGYGARGRSWPAREPPAPDAVEWSALGAVPVALVTGSNGKTTTVRLVAAMLARAGHTVGFCCSDGVFIGGEQVERGDWSGPAGARLVLRDPRVTAAVLETARGGLLRRGLVVPHATAALVTNVAEDHFGGYGIESLIDLAEAKLVVARALGPEGTLLLNGDDVTLRAATEEYAGPIEWFSAASPSDLVPPADAMPLALGGAAWHNVANAVGAAQLAHALGVEREPIDLTLRSFGRENADNPGRLERFEVGGVRVWVDYAHNPHGLGELLFAAARQRGGGRLGLLLGQAGDREDDAIRALARTAWAAHPERIVLKDLDDGYLRGRSPGEVPAILEAELLAQGAPPERISTVPDETSGVRALLEWATVGDLLVLPVHALSARERAIQLVQNWT